MSSHTWDQDDHLIQARFVDSSSDTAKTVDYRYCRTCSGSRTEKIVKDEYGFITEWLRYEMEGLNHLRIDERYDSPGDANSVIDDNDPWRVQRVYYNGPGQLGQIVKATVWEYTSTPTATDYYYGYDILGNVSVISNNSGTEVDQFEQDAFGNEVEGSWSSPAGDITEHLTTKQYDADLGLYYFNARWYNPTTGVFLSRDPGGTPRCSSYQTRHRPVLNVFTMSHNDPVDNTDPTGRKTRKCTAEEEQALYTARQEALLAVYFCCLKDDLAKQRLLALLEKATFHCMDLPSNPLECADSTLGIIKINPKGFAGDCGCLAAVLIHEAAHVALKTMKEIKPDACELCSYCSQNHGGNYSLDDCTTRSRR